MTNALRLRAHVEARVNQVARKAYSKRNAKKDRREKDKAEKSHSSSKRLRPAQRTHESKQKMKRRDKVD